MKRQKERTHSGVHNRKRKREKDANVAPKMCLHKPQKASAVTPGYSRRSILKSESCQGENKHIVVGLQGDAEGVV